MATRYASNNCHSDVLGSIPRPQVARAVYGSPRERDAPHRTNPPRFRPPRYRSEHRQHLPWVVVLLLLLLLLLLVVVVVVLLLLLLLAGET